MIEATSPVFPNNAISIMATRVRSLDDDLSVFKRPVRPTDPNQTVGIFGMLWQPDDSSYEMLGRPESGTPGSNETTLQSYVIALQAFVKDTDEERGLAVHSVLSEMIRNMLYRDVPLRVGLSSLATTSGGVTKRAKRWTVRNQRYLSNEIQGQFIYLSTLEAWLETETI